jgi:hypothetical protein
MVGFYPREVRKILSRRKTTNSANSVAVDLKLLKPPKQVCNTKKTMSKMHSLGVC